MQLRLAILAVLCLPAWGAITLTQQASAVDTLGNGYATVTLATNHTGGTLLAHVAIQHLGGVVSTVTGGGATWALATAESSTNDAELWCGSNSTGSAAPIIVTSTVTGRANALTVIVSEIAGGWSCNLDGTNKKAGTGTAWGTNSITTTVAADMLWAVGQGAQNPGSPTNSFTALTSPTASAAAAYQIETIIGTYSTGWTATSGTYSAAIAAIKPLPAVNLTASPLSIPYNGAGYTVTLTGTGTAWTNVGTTFTVSGVSGVSKVSQNVTSTTAATIVIATTGTAGILTISDGTNTNTIQVLATSLYANPVAPNTNTSTTITFTGVNTLWVGLTASTLFSVSGSTGAALSSVTINSNTSATATLTIGSTAGTMTITDTSTGSAATLGVNQTFGLNEAYVESTFLAGVQQFVVTTSPDGVNWTTEPSSSISGVRDPSIIKLNNGQWAMVYNDASQGSISTVTLYAGPSLNALSFVAYVPVISMNNAWAPTFFLDPANPTMVYMTVSDATTGIYLLSASQSNLASWSAPTLLLSFGALQEYDGTLVKKGSTYYLFYVGFPSGQIGQIYYATSSTLAGTYSGATVVLPTTQSSPVSWYESPVVVYSAITGYRLYCTAADAGGNLGDQGGFYVQLNSDFTLNGTPIRFYTNGSTETQHGTVLNQPVQAARVIP